MYVYGYVYLEFLSCRENSENGRHGGEEEEEEQAQEEDEEAGTDRGKDWE
jgi:hypothetical protein